MIIVSFLVGDKENRFCFFEEIFLLANISINIALGMPSFIFSKIEINFVDHHLH